MIAKTRPFFLPGRLAFDTGTKADYRKLERFHYVARRPATFAAVAVARYLPDAGAPRVIGVAVLSWPSALHRTRHRVFGLKSMGFGERLRWVNAHVRTVSRVIVHPQFRSLGLSTRLIEAAVAVCPTPYVEASARMGRAHPLFDRVGFTRVEPATPREPLYFWRSTVAPLSHVPTGSSGGDLRPVTFVSPATVGRGTPMNAGTHG